MNNLEEIQAELTALSKAIELIDKDHKDGTITDVFYFKRRISLLRDNELALKKLKDILDNNNASEVSSVLDKVTSGAEEEEVEKELEKAQEAGETKGWGEVIKETLRAKKGSIVRTAIDVALNVAKFLL